MALALVPVRVQALAQELAGDKAQEALQVETKFCANLIHYSKHHLTYAVFSFIVL